MKLLLLILLSISSFAEWKKLDEDLYFKSINYDSGLFSSDLILIKTKLEKFSLSVVHAKELGKESIYVDDAVKARNAILGINANYFDEFGNALGLVVSKGIQRSKVHKGGDTLTGIFYLNKSTYKIVNRDKWKNNSALEAIQGGPRLIYDGKIVQKIKNNLSSSRRTGVCIDRDDNLVFYITSGVVGIGISQLQELLFEVGCQDALNMDGGGSAQFFLSSKNESNQEISINGKDPVPVVLLLDKITD